MDEAGWDPGTGADGGWFVSADMRDSVTDEGFYGLVGQRPGGLTGPVEVLRVRSTINGLTQSFPSRASMAAGRIAYFCNALSAAGWLRTVWIDDQLVLSEGDSVQTPSGVRFWRSFNGLHLTPAGALYVWGGVTDAGGQYAGQVWIEVFTQSVLLGSGDTLPGYAAPVAELTNEPRMSPTGVHWATGVRFSDGYKALVADGSIVDYWGTPFVLGNPLPPQIAGGTSLQFWEGIVGVDINDAGDLAVGVVGYQNSVQTSLVIRNGLPIVPRTHSFPLVGIDPQGAMITWENFAVPISIEGRPIFNASTGIDLDRDGVAEPNLAFSSVGYQGILDPGPQGVSGFVASYGPAGMPPTGSGFFFARNFRVDRPHCAAAANSTGRAAALMMAGDATASSNELSLRAFGMPPQTVGFFLLSRTPGFVAQAGGSQGNLCLGGSIGRLNQQIFQTEFWGTGSADVDLAAIPQPSGTVSASAGETWYAQAWFRDTVGGTATSNFTSGSSITLQ